METMYNDRVKYKNLMLKSKQEYENNKDPKLLKEISIIIYRQKISPQPLWCNW